MQPPATLSSRDRHREPFMAGAYPVSAVSRDDARVAGAGLAVSAAIILGIALGSAAVTWLGVLVALAIAVVWPPAGLVVLAFMTPMVSPAVVPAPGFNTVLVGALVFGTILRLPIDRPRLRPSVPVLVIVGFMAYVFVQQLPAMLSGYSGEHDHTVGYHFFQLVTLAGAALVAAVILQRRSPAPLLFALVTSGVLAAALAIAASRLGATDWIINLLVDEQDLTRAAGSFGDPNYFGLFLATAFALAAGCLLAFRRPAQRFGLSVALVVLGLGLATTLSRSAILACVAGILALVFTQGRRAGLIAAGAVLVFGLISYPVFVELRLEREAGAASVQAQDAMAESDQGRLSGVLVGPDLFARSPILGIGLGEYSYAAAEVTDPPRRLFAHNWYVTVLVQQGLVGAAMWLVLLGSIALAMRWRPGPARAVGFAVLTTLIVGCFFLEVFVDVKTAALSTLALTAALTAAWQSPAATVPAEPARPLPI